MDPRAPRPSWTRCLRRGAMWMGVGMVSLVLGGWLARVPIINAALARIPGEYAISISGAAPSMRGIVLSGLKVLHRTSGLLLVESESAEFKGAWSELRAGRLDTLILSGARVTWRDDFLSLEPVVLGSERVPLPIVFCGRTIIRGGAFSWYEKGAAAARFFSNVEWHGGAITVYDNGTLDGTAQDLKMTDVVVADKLFGAALKVEIPECVGTVSASHGNHSYTIHEVKMTSPVISVSEESARPPVGEILSIESVQVRPPLRIVVERGSAENGNLHSTFPRQMISDVGALSLAVENLVMGQGVPLTWGTADFTASQLTLPGVKAKGLALVTNMSGKGMTIKTGTVTDASIVDPAALGRYLNLTDFPQISGQFKAHFSEVTVNGSDVRSSAVQELSAENLTFMVPGVLANVKSARLAASLDEMVQSRRFREVTLVVPDVNLSGEALLARNGTITTGPQASSLEPSRPVWEDWKVQKVEVVDGRISVRNLGRGIPDGSAGWQISTRPVQTNVPAVIRATLHDVELRNSLAPESPIHTGQEIAIEIVPETVWHTHELDLFINGDEIKPEALMKAFGTKDSPPAETLPAAPPAPTPPTSSSFKPWRLRKLVVENTSVTMDDVGDGRRLHLVLPRQEFTDLPLNAAELQNRVDRVYKIDPKSHRFLFAMPEMPQVGLSRFSYRDRRSMENWLSNPDGTNSRNTKSG